MVGYWERPDQTAAALRDGWLHTGDIGRMDAEQYVFVRGRLSERLTIDGEHWYPRDIEEIFVRQPGVRQAALVARPDGRGSSVPVAYVVPGGGELDADELVRHVVEELGRAPAGLTIQTIAEMPMTPTGKISKAELLELADSPALPHG